MPLSFRWRVQFDDLGADWHPSFGCDCSHFDFWLDRGLHYLLFPRSKRSTSHERSELLAHILRDRASSGHSIDPGCQICLSAHLSHVGIDFGHVAH